MNRESLKQRKESSHLLEKWNFIQCLSSTPHSYTYLIQEKTTLSYYILKIFTHHTFSKRKYHILSLFSDKYFILPVTYQHSLNADFLFFEKETTLKEILLDSGLTFHELLDLGIDLIHIGLELKKHHFYEIDISPSNIYQKKDGTFCLGDLNLQKDFIKGTPPYIPPENFKTSFSKKKTDFNFEKSLSFSICMLLKNIFDLNPLSQSKSFLQILETGLQENPEKRFSSLEEFKDLLLKERKQESFDNSSLFQIEKMNHPLFEKKTISLSNKTNSVFFISLWIGIIITGCIFLTALYQHLHSDSNSIPIETSTVTSSTNIKESPTTSSTILSVTKEIDVQKNGLTSFPIDITNPDSVSYIYAGENQLTEISSDFDFPNLKELYLNDNKLYDITGLSHAENLEVLCVSYNNLQDISPLVKLPQLSFLDISSNPKFTDINSLLQMKQLTTLNISNTGLSRKQYELLRRKLPECNIICTNFL